MHNSVIFCHAYILFTSSENSFLDLFLKYGMEMLTFIPTVAGIMHACFIWLWKQNSRKEFGKAC